MTELIKDLIFLGGDKNTNSNPSDNFLRQLPQAKAMSGEFFVGISTDSREDALKALGDKSYKTTADLTAIETAKFMSKSEVDLGDDFLNKCFYIGMTGKCKRLSGIPICCIQLKIIIFLFLHHRSTRLPEYPLN